MSNEWFVAGLDIGQAADYTALAILQAVNPVEMRGVPVVEPAIYSCRHLERFELGTPYPAMVDKVRQRLSTPQLRGRTALVVDATGVGAPVLDLLHLAGLNSIGVTIHGGENVVTVDGGYRVPKRDLVAAVQVLLQQERLKVAERLPEAATLVTELTNFRYTLSAAGHDSYGAWRDGEHDDLVLAVALAVWVCECAPMARTEIVSLHQPIGPRW